MIKRLLILAFIFILAFFTWSIVFEVAKYITSVSLGYETYITRYGVDSEIRHIYKEREQRDFEGNPLPADPVFESNWLLYKISGAVAVILVGLFGCAVVWFSKRDSRLLKHPYKWIWIYFAMYLMRTPIAVIVFHYRFWTGAKYCVPGDAEYVWYFGLDPTIFTPIICAVLILCLGTALFKAMALPAIKAEPFEQYE